MQKGGSHKGGRDVCHDSSVDPVAISVDPVAISVDPVGSGSAIRLRCIFGVFCIVRQSEGDRVSTEKDGWSGG